MNKRITHILIFLFTAILLHGQQLSFEGWSKNHLGVDSYEGALRNDGITLAIRYTGTNLFEPDWKLSVQVISPFQSKNKTFPSNRIMLLPVRTEGQSNNPGPLPTVRAIGIASPVRLAGMSEVFIVPSSNIALHNVSTYNSYYSLELIFNFMVEGGAYLSELQGYISYPGVLRFTLYRQDNSVIGVYDVNFTIQVNKLTGAPPSNEYSISFSTEATNAQIEMNTVSDYVNGKNVTYHDGLTVSATTGYQVTVRSVDPHFTSVSGKTLPLNVVRMQLTGETGSSVPNVLSYNRSTILQGESTNGSFENFDVTYSTEPNDQQLYDASSDYYSTHLMFEITPR